MNNLIYILFTIFVIVTAFLAKGKAITYILFGVLAILSVLAIRGDLHYVFPIVSHYIDNFKHHLETILNQFNGHRAPINPDPSEQNLLNSGPVTNFPIIMSAGIAISFFLAYAILMD